MDFSRIRPLPCRRTHTSLLLATHSTCTVRLAKEDDGSHYLGLALVLLYERRKIEILVHRTVSSRTNEDEKKKTEPSERVHSVLCSLV